MLALATLVMACQTAQGLPLVVKGVFTPNEVFSLPLVRCSFNIKMLASLGCPVSAGLLDFVAGGMISVLLLGHLGLPACRTHRQACTHTHKARRTCTHGSIGLVGVDPLI